jgi:hypothetical protein
MNSRLFMCGWTPCFRPKDNTTRQKEGTAALRDFNPAYDLVEVTLAAMSGQSPVSGHGWAFYEYTTGRSCSDWKTERVKEIVIFRPESSAAVKPMLGRCWNEGANARDYLWVARHHAEPGWL